MMDDAILKWLECVLYERFGVHFTLCGAQAGFVTLSPAGSATRISIVSDPATFCRSDSQLSYTTWDAADEGWKPAIDDVLPAPGAQCLPVPLVQATHSGQQVNYDILGLAYWMLSRHEELGRTDLDAHGRFPAIASHAYRHDYLERPIVDEWLHILAQIIERQWPQLQLRRQVFSMKVSHDVDTPSRYGFRSARGVLRAMAGDVLRRRDLKGALRAPWLRLASHSALHPADPANTFDWIMDLSERHGLASAFYFICGRTDPQKDADYDIEHPAIRRLLRRIHARGHEIGLHPSYNTYQNPAAIASEAQRLRGVCQEEGVGQSAWGGRMHYLRWEHPTTMLGWEQAGMAYDSSLSYADRPGFRCGTCFEYPAFDPIEKRQLSLRLRPLIAMEATILADAYMGLGTSEAALEKFQQLKDRCRAVGGCFTVLWHNSQFESIAERTLYGRVLES